MSWLLFALLLLLFTQTSHTIIGDGVTKFGFITDSVNPGDGTILTIKLYWNDTKYSCNLNPNAINTEYSCNGSSATPTPPTIEIPYYVKIEYNTVNPIQIAMINVTDNMGVWYAIDRFCVASHMQHTMNKIIADNSTKCKQWGSKQKYNTLALGGDTEFTLLYIDYHIFGDRFVNMRLEGGVRPPNLKYIGVLTGTSGESGVNVSIQWDIGLYTCNFDGSGSNQRRNCSLSVPLFCSAIESDFYISFYNHIGGGGALTIDELTFEDETGSGRKYSFQNFCQEPSTFIQFLSEGTCSTTNYVDVQEIWVGGAANSLVPILIPLTFFDYPNEPENIQWVEVTNGSYPTALPAPPSSEFSWEYQRYAGPIAAACPITPDPTYDPTIDPTMIPTNAPTTNNPTNEPTIDPTVDPTIHPTNDPTSYPTTYPTIDPTSHPTNDPTNIPTLSPTCNADLDLKEKHGECERGYKVYGKDPRCCTLCPLGEYEDGGECIRCGDGKRPNEKRTRCIFCIGNRIGNNGECDVDCGAEGNLANELHTQCEEIEKWYGTDLFNALMTIVGVFIGLPCMDKDNTLDPSEVDKKKENKKKIEIVLIVCLVLGCFACIIVAIILSVRDYESIPGPTMRGAEPTIESTPNPTTYPTMYPTIEPTTELISDDDKKKAKWLDPTTYGLLNWIIVAAAFCLLCVFCCFLCRCCFLFCGRGNRIKRKGSGYQVGQAMFNKIDSNADPDSAFQSDLKSAIEMNSKGKYVNKVESLGSLDLDAVNTAFNMDFDDNNKNEQEPDEQEQDKQIEKNNENDINVNNADVDPTPHNFDDYDLL